MYTIMTVCTGNICRSPMGEYLIRDAARRAGLNLTVDSSAISAEEVGNPIDPRAHRVLAEAGINADTHRARQFRTADFAHHDLILAMDLNHYRALTRMAPTPEDRAKIHLMREFDPALAQQPHDSLGIYDPWYGDQEDFYTTFAMIRDAVPGVIERAQTDTAHN